jgi:hypothetical protein
MAQRAITDIKEGFARKGGALLFLGSKPLPWFREVMAQPPVRVGRRPK